MARFIKERAAAARDLLGKPLLVEEWGKEVSVDQHWSRQFDERDRYARAMLGAIEVRAELLAEFS